MWRTALVFAVCAAVLAPPASAAPPYVGNPVASWQPSPFPTQAQGAAVSPDGKVLYVTDIFDRVLEYSTADGSYLGGFGAAGSKPGQFDSPRGVAVDPYGDVWVADTGNGRVQKFTAGGAPLLSFDSAQPIGVAATASEMYVLSGLFRAVGVRSLTGQDQGAFVANFPDGYDVTSHYGAPANTADGIAADTSGNAVVTGTVSTPLTNPDRPSCKSPLSTLPDLPDPLVAPAVTTFDDKGSAVGQRWTWRPGAICWSSNLSAWSYGLTGVKSNGTVAVDPASNVAYASMLMRNSGPYFVDDDQSPDTLGIWDPRDGPALNGSGISSSLYGPLRTFAIGCDSSMYLITDSRIQRFTSSTPDMSHCGIRSKAAAVPFSTFPALGGAPPPKSAANSIDFGGVCHTVKSCGGTVVVDIRPCLKCPPIGVIRQKFKVPGGKTKVLSVKLPRRIAKRLEKGKALVASLKVGKGKATTLPLAGHRSLTAKCGGVASAAVASARQFTVQGAVSPARRGTKVQISLTGPDGKPQLLTATTDKRGRYTLTVPAVQDGPWTVDARLPGTRQRETAEGNCGVMVGPEPATLAGPVDAVGPDISEVDLALSCPGSATAGQDLAIPGALKPPDQGVNVGLTIGAPGGGTTSTSVVTASGGTFGTRFVPDAAGDWTVSARADSAGTTLVRSCTIAVSRQATELTLTCPSTAIPFPGTQKFEGDLTPPVPGATVTVTFTQAGATGETDTGIVDAAGHYSVTFSEPAPGSWSAQASWPGDAAHGPASAPSCAFMVG